MSTEEAINSTCPICFDADTTHEASLCPDSSHATVCRPCMGMFIDQKIADASMGSCPVISCPCEHRAVETVSETEGASLSEEEKRKRRIPRQKILSFGQWTTLGVASAENVEKYLALASSLLYFLCAGCHTLKTVLVERPTAIAQQNEVQERLENAIRRASGEDGDLEVFDNPGEQGSASQPADAGLAAVNRFRAIRQQFELGDMDLEDFFTEVYSRLLPSLITLPDKDAWPIFKDVLQVVENPERRANLQLRYLRGRPRMWTPCCNKEHCFKCRTKDFHEGKSCSENTAQLDGSIVPCPKCGISLVKGDGCNSVTCVCKHQFSWSDEMMVAKRVAKFLSSCESVSPLSACVSILCGEVVGDAGDASAWRRGHVEDVDRALLKWWERKYAACPSQACVVLPYSSAFTPLFPSMTVEDQSQTIPSGVRDAHLKWDSVHKREINNLRAQSRNALRSLFTTMVPVEAERARAAVRMLHRGAKHFQSRQGVDSRLLASCKVWAAEHKSQYEAEVSRFESTMADQFLFLFGDRCPAADLLGPNFAPEGVPQVTEWNVAISNSHLTFTRDNTAVERVGSVSTYPAALATLPAAHCKLVVRVEKCCIGPNWLTFGVSSRLGTGSFMPVENSDGMGRTSGTYGIYDDRNSRSENATLAASGSTIDRWRKFQENDIITGEINTEEGWFEITLNDHEHFHRFEIEAGRQEDYVFAMTFANDHLVCIVNDDSSTGPAGGGGSAVKMNEEHLAMRSALKRRMKALCDMDAVDVSDVMDLGRLQTQAAAWESSHGGSSAHAEMRVRELSCFLEKLLGVTNLTSLLSSSQRGGGDFDFEQGGHQQLNALEIMAVIASTETWRSIENAICWLSIQATRLKREQDTELALVFYTEHEDSAPFVAAAQFADHTTIRHTTMTHLKRAALAYMQMFPDDMNDWYDYNLCLEEPFLGLGRADRNCRCLPRHNCAACPFFGEN